MLLSHNTLSVCPGASPVELERGSQQECEAGTGSFVPCRGLAILEPLSHLIAQGWLLLVKNRARSLNLLRSSALLPPGSNEPFLVLEKEVR